MRNRGYSAERVNTVETAYHNTPTMLQRASYEKFLINLAKIGDLEALNDLISSGLSPNPANIYGESLCHMVCRQGHSSVLKLMIDLGCELQVCDDYGRTPLHDACWASKPAFEVVETLMAAGDTYHLFTMVDNRGSTPLSYIRKEHWAEWIQFLEAKKDVYWPARDKSEGMKEPPAITQERPHSRPLLDPEDALTLKLASMVASGAITPIEARQLMEEDNESTSGDDDSSYQDDTECSGSSYSDDEGDDSDCSLDEATMVNILQHMTAPDAKGKVIAWASNSTTSLDEMAQILEVLSNNGRKPIAWSQ